MIIDLNTKVSRELVEPWLSLQENKHIAMGHIGTHLDTYNKSEIPLEYFKRNGKLIDIEDISEKREIEIEDLDNVEIEKGDFVIFKTGRIGKIYGTEEYFKNHPQLSNKLIDYLIEKKVSFIGIDASGIRRGDEHTDADKLCEENQVFVIENLDNLDKINSSNFTVYTMWLEDEEATGLKCRVICEIK